MRRGELDADVPLVSLCEVASLMPAPWNARTDHDVAGIVESIKVNGFRDPIEVWAFRAGARLPEPHEIVAGEGRYRAAVELTLQRVPVVEHDFTDEAAAKRYSIANNRLTDKSRFDLPALQTQLEALPELRGTGFDVAELGELRDENLRAAGGKALLTDEDEVPEALSEVVTRSGDLWVMGDHRLFCGDAKEADAWERLVLDHMLSALIMDPPYNVGFGYEGEYAGHDSKQDDEYGQWLWSICTRAEARLMPGALCFVWQSMVNCRHWHEWFPRDFRLFASIKGMVQFRPTAVQFSWDPVVFWKTGGNSDIRPRAGRRDYFVSSTATWLQVDGPEHGGHPCPRPLDAVAYIVDQFTVPQASIVDPFVGSGTTIIAAEKLGRRCYAMEISEKYVDVAVRRWQNTTGRDAILEETGETFAHVARHGRSG